MAETITTWKNRFDAAYESWGGDGGGTVKREFEAASNLGGQLADRAYYVFDSTLSLAIALYGYHGTYIDEDDAGVKGDAGEFTGTHPYDEAGVYNGTPALDNTDAYKTYFNRLLNWADGGDSTYQTRVSWGPTADYAGGMMAAARITATPNGIPMKYWAGDENKNDQYHKTTPPGQSVGRTSTTLTYAFGLARLVRVIYEDAALQAISDPGAGTGTYLSRADVIYDFLKDNVARRFMNYYNSTYGGDQVENMNDWHNNWLPRIDYPVRNKQVRLLRFINQMTMASKLKSKGDHDTTISSWDISTWDKFLYRHGVELGKRLIPADSGTPISGLGEGDKGYENGAGERENRTQDWFSHTEAGGRYSRFANCNTVSLIDGAWKANPNVSAGKALIWDCGMDEERYHTTVDTSHAGLTPTFVMEAYEHFFKRSDHVNIVTSELETGDVDGQGKLLTLDHVDGMVDLYKNVIYHPNLTTNNTLFSLHIDGTEGNCVSGSSCMVGWHSWVKLAQYDDSTDAKDLVDIMGEVSDIVNSGRNQGLGAIPTLPGYIGDVGTIAQNGHLCFAVVARAGGGPVITDPTGPYIIPQKLGGDGTWENRETNFDGGEEMLITVKNAPQTPTGSSVGPKDNAANQWIGLYHIDQPFDGVARPGVPGVDPEATIQPYQQIWKHPGTDTKEPGLPTTPTDTMTLTMPAETGHYQLVYYRAGGQFGAMFGFSQIMVDGQDGGFLPFGPGGRPGIPPMTDREISHALYVDVAKTLHDAANAFAGPTKEPII